MHVQNADGVMGRVKPNDNATEAGRVLSRDNATEAGPPPLVKYEDSS